MLNERENLKSISNIYLKLIKSTLHKLNIFKVIQPCLTCMLFSVLMFIKLVILINCKSSDFTMNILLAVNLKAACVLSIEQFSQLTDRLVSSIELNVQQVKNSLKKYDFFWYFIVLKLYVFCRDLQQNSGSHYL